MRIMMRTGFCCYQLSSPAFYKLDKVRAQVNQNKMADEEAAIAAIPDANDKINNFTKNPDENPAGRPTDS